jgi:parallel beta-helix repeat protein
MKTYSPGWKGLTLGVLVLFIGANVTSLQGAPGVKEDSIDVRASSLNFGSRGNTLYVGGSGGGNYSSIQAAIDNASSGDTIFVFDDSSPYYENVIVDKTINLVGEDKNTTIINGNESDIAAVQIIADGVILCGFTTCNVDYDDGVIISGSFNNISGNMIMNNNGVGILLYDSFNNISGNVIANNQIDGIYMSDASDNIITRNSITNNGYNGITLGTSSSNDIIENTIMNNDEYGIEIPYYGYDSSDDNYIYLNNFINNGQHALDECVNSWDRFGQGNYWDDFDEAGEGAWDNNSDGIVDDPYSIPGGSNKDWYPLMTPRAVHLPVINQNTGEMFLTIMHAITDLDTTDGHTILVDTGTYYENIVVDKSIILIGASSDTAIIDVGWMKEHVVSISADGVNVSRFTIQNSFYNGIQVTSDYCTIAETSITNNSRTGIVLGDLSANNTIRKNKITYNDDGIELLTSSDNRIVGNLISANNNYGIYLGGSAANTINDNFITSNTDGFVLFAESDNNVIFGNDITNNENSGISLLGQPTDNIICHNNFINNTNLNAFDAAGDNIWDDGYPSGGNYWDDYSGVDNFSGPKQNVSGSDGIGDTPYNISGGDKQDRYPLMEPWNAVYVDDDFNESTPGWNYDHFNTIQEGINAVAVNGDVIVYEGTYVENLVINKKIDLIGIDNRDAIIIDGNKSGDVVYVSAHGVGISGFTIQNSDIFGMNVRSNYNTISGNKISNNYVAGIYCYSHTHHNTISGNHISNNDYAGICLHHNTQSKISTNTITNNNYSIWVLHGHHNNISKNVISNSSYEGIELESTSNNTLFENTIVNISLYSIYLHSESSDNVITRNTIKNNNYSIYIVGDPESPSDNNRIYHNNFINNQHVFDNCLNTWNTSMDGNYWSDFDDSDEGAYDNYHGPNQDELGSDGIVDKGLAAGGGLNPYNISGGDNQDKYPLMNSYNPGFPVLNVDTGERFNTIQRAIMDNETCNGHTIFVENDTYYGHVAIVKSIVLSGENKEKTVLDGGGSGDVVQVLADGVNINGFTIQNSGCNGSPHYDAGIDIASNDTTTLSGNDIIRNYIGIHLHEATDSTISGNTLTDTNHWAIYAKDSSNNNILDNDIIDNNYHGIYLLDSDYIVIDNNTVIDNGEHGIYLSRSSNNTLSDNRIINNSDKGIRLGDSFNNSIEKNEISGNYNFGISLLASAENNSIYHNNFINKGMRHASDAGNNSWDDGYPSGGNYWDDYTGVDFFSGPGQNLSGSDGIGDTPYNISGGDEQDNYPLMDPWVSYLCSDVNNDGIINVGDVVYLITYLYRGGSEPIPQLCVGDANCDDIVNVGDVVYLITYLYRGGAPPCTGCCA